MNIKININITAIEKLRQKQEEDEKKRREYEEQQKIEQAQKQKEKLLAEKEKSAQNASEITGGLNRLKTPRAGKKKNSLDVTSDFEDGDMTDVTDSEYYDETANEDGSDNNENDYNNTDDDDENLDEPVVVQLSQEELDRLAQERRLAEIEEKRKQAERAKILEEAMHSRLCLESVELVKRESEQMCWVLIAPRI